MIRPPPNSSPCMQLCPHVIRRSRSFSYPAFSVMATLLETPCLAGRGYIDGPPANKTTTKG
jgi:hypothetical protein